LSTALRRFNAGQASGPERDVRTLSGDHAPIDLIEYLRRQRAGCTMMASPATLSANGAPPPTNQGATNDSFPPKRDTE
jgi:hypothetical protein